MYIKPTFFLEPNCFILACQTTPPHLGVILGPTQNLGAVRKAVSMKTNKNSIIISYFLFYFKFSTGTANFSSNIVKHLLHFDPELQKEV